MNRGAMISVDQLAAVPSLGLRYLAGSDGGPRLVTWAHACDLPDPWAWFDSGDLVLTTGGGLPSDATAQRDWIESLIDSGVAGLVVALSPSAPALSSALLEAADARGFPVLSASFELQFVSLARTVIESAVEAERQRVAAIKRMYDVYWQSLHRRVSMGERMSALESSTGWMLEVHEPDSSVSVATGRRAFAQPTSDRGSEVTVAMPGVAGLVLAARPDRREVGDMALLEHLAGLVSLELEHAAAARDRSRASGEALMSGLLDESITLSGVWPELRHRGMSGTIVVACWESATGATLDHAQVHHQIGLQDYAPLLLRHGSTLVGVMPYDHEALRAVGRALAPDCAVGVSLPLAVNSQVTESARQAHLAVSRAHDQHTDVVAYGDDSTGLDLLQGSVEDIRRLLRRVLGPLIKYDRDNDSELVTSVRTFIDNDGAWQRSADELTVHRQTLVYRLKKVEQLTGLRPGSTEGSALFWLAFTGADRARLELDDLDV